MKYQLEQAPIAKTEMLIRKPVSEVFEAFINPDITTKFWFTKSSGKLEQGKQVTWTWEMYNVSTPVEVKEIEKDKRIFVIWGNHDRATEVEWVFKRLDDEGTFVSITVSGFQGDGDKVVEEALGSVAGFTWVLAGLKAYLEHNIQLNLVADRFPKGLNQ